MRRDFSIALALLASALLTTGCGGFVARRIAQSPNTYPRWLAASPRGQLGFAPEALTNVAAKTLEVGPPPARLQYRIVEPADYGLRMAATNWIKGKHPRFMFRFAASVPGGSNAWTASPRGTV